MFIAGQRASAPTMLSYTRVHMLVDRALDRGCIGVFYAFKIPKTHWRWCRRLKIQSKNDLILPGTHTCSNSVHFTKRDKSFFQFEYHRSAQWSLKLFCFTAYNYCPGHQDLFLFSSESGFNPAVCLRTRSNSLCFRSLGFGRWSLWKNNQEKYPSHVVLILCRNVGGDKKMETLNPSNTTVIP
jgi:hypothetical protein